MKIKKRIIQFLAFVAVLSTSYSCSDDFFTEEAGNRITPEQHYKSQKDLQTSIKGTYYPLQKALPKLLLLDGLRSDLMDVTSSADVYMKDIYNQNFSVNNPYLDGSDYYKTIVNVNEVLNNMDKVYERDPTTIEYMPKYVRGSLINIRSWCYLTLVKLFGEAYLINDNMLSAQSGGKLLSKKDMIDTLINQLKPFVFTSTTFTELELRGPNTKCLLGELYLENQNYDSAAYYLKLGLESYNNKYYKVKSTFSKETWKLLFYKDGWTGEKGGDENLDIINYDSKRDQYNEFTGWTINRLVKPSQLLIDSYNSQESKKGLGDVNRGKGITYDTMPGSNTEYYVSKYNLEKGEPYSSYIILTRGADLHLLLAEALINKSVPDTTVAMGLLNRGIKSLSPTPKGYSKWTGNVGIRGRVDVNPKYIPSNVDINDPVAVKYAIEDLIIEERALELAFEGKRWFDLIRVAERRNDPSYLADKIAAKYSDPAQANNIRTKLLDKANWYLKNK